MTSPPFTPLSTAHSPPEGMLLLNKPRGYTSFKLVHLLRKRLGVKKIGHAGTLDPFATGVMVMLVSRAYTRLSDSFLSCEKEYRAELILGIATDTYDCEGTPTFSSSHIPTQEEIERMVATFQGALLQVPPMYSAKKQNGKRLYELARKGIEVERAPVPITVQVTLLHYAYPHVELNIVCSKGTYIRSLAHDMGLQLGCGAHLNQLTRTRSGIFTLSQCVDGMALETSTYPLLSHLLTV